MRRRMDTIRRPFIIYAARVQFLRCIRAEWRLVHPRLIRTRLGLSLLLTGALLVWLRDRGLDSLTIVLQAGALGAVIGAAFMAGSDEDRAAFATALTHPTTPLAIATGRWLGTVAPAVALSIGCTLALGWRTGNAAAGMAAAIAVGGCALAAVVALGQGGAIALFFFISVAGVVPPERLVDLAHPGVARLAAASVLELGPALWHYRDVATGDLAAVAHSSAWGGLGVLLTAGFVARRR
jgi:hypothetical protein